MHIFPIENEVVTPISTPSPVKTAVLIVAAGRGQRFGGGLAKQYRDLLGKPVLVRTLETFLNHQAVGTVQVVIGAGDDDLYAEITPPHDKLLPPVTGGATRQDSVRLGLERLAGNQPEQVLIHDGARPFADEQLIDRLIAALKNVSGAYAAIPVADTLRRHAQDGSTVETVDRTGLWQAQTPQAFRFDAILKAHRGAAGDALTDDVAVAEQAGLSIAMVEGSRRNFKITTQADLEMAEMYLSTGGNATGLEVRTGFGYDVHRFEPGESVTLCGVAVPHDHKLKGHSDADVGMHAVTDALLGAIGAGDIGTHFPPSDATWKDAASQVFLSHADRLLKDRGGRIVNADITLICEAPKIGPHRAAMLKALSGILGLDSARISVKATTTEKLGFTGRGEGIAAQAVVTVELPRGD